MSPLFSGSGEAATAEPAPETASGPPVEEGMAVRTLVGQRHGVDLSRVPVDRTVEGAGRAQQMRARGFTSPAGIVIPPQVGTLEAGPGQALLAHELTHVAQRARLGLALPPDHTDAGRALEVEALTTEMAFAPSPAMRSLRPAAANRPGTARSGASGTAPGPSLPLAAAPSGGPDHEALASSIVERLSGLTAGSPWPGGETTMVMTPGGAPSFGGAPAMAGGGIQRADEDPGPAGPGSPSGPPVAGPSAPPPSHPDDEHGPFSERPSEAELSNLTQWLYPLISYRLKGELREGRERAGLLTEHYRRW